MAEFSSGVRLPSLFLNLPPELIQNILSHLDPIHLGVIAKTCRLLNNISYDDRIWQPTLNRTLQGSVSRLPSLAGSYRDLYVAHHPNWFLPRYKIWFADTQTNGKLLVARYNPGNGSIEAYQVVAFRGLSTNELWTRSPGVIIHSFEPKVGLDMNQPVLKLDIDRNMMQAEQPFNLNGGGRSSPFAYNEEIVMDTFIEEDLYGSFMLCRDIPASAVGNGTQVWPPLRIPAYGRTRNATGNGYNSSGHRPSRLHEVSEHNFRLRKWVEFGRHQKQRAKAGWSSSSVGSAIDAALNVGIQGHFISTARAASVTRRFPEQITTYATLPPECYTPTPEKPYQGIWCGDYSGHGCEFLLITQPDKENETPLPDGLAWLRRWFSGGRRRSRDSESSDAEEIDYAEAMQAQFQYIAALEGFHVVPNFPIASASEADDGATTASGSNDDMTDLPDVPSGRLEAIKLTGDLNIPRGEHTFIAPDIGHGGFMRVADEDIFRGARVVRSAGHIAGRGFRDDEWTPSQLILLSHNRLAQFWEAFGHISYFERVDLDALVNFAVDPLDSTVS